MYAIDAYVNDAVQKEPPMTERRVSVHLAAVGGRQMRAELEGVGEAGKRGFGQLSREMEAANALHLMGNVARAVWAGIRTTMSSFVDDFRALRADIEGIWTRLMAFLAGKWAEFLGRIGPTFNAVTERIGAGGLFANIFRAGGLVGAPRMHGGRWAGLRPDEVPAILQRGERVLSRREAGRAGPRSQGRSDRRTRSESGRNQARHASRRRRCWPAAG